MSNTVNNPTSVNRGVDKQIGIYLCSGLETSNEKKPIIDKHNDIGSYESHRHKTELKEMQKHIYYMIPFTGCPPLCATVDWNIYGWIYMTSRMCFKNNIGGDMNE